VCHRVVAALVKGRVPDHYAHWTDLWNCPGSGMAPEEV
jgi:hypothetical protein